MKNCLLEKYINSRFRHKVKTSFGDTFALLLLSRGMDTNGEVTSLLSSRSTLLPSKIKGTPGIPNCSMLPNHFPIPEKLIGDENE